MLGMGPILWRLALTRTYPRLRRDSLALNYPPMRRRLLEFYGRQNPAAALYYKMIDRATLNLPIL